MSIERRMPDDGCWEPFMKVYDQSAKIWLLNLKEKVNPRVRKIVVEDEEATMQIMDVRLAELGEE